MPDVPHRKVVWIVDDSPIEAEHARRALEGVFDLEVFNDGSAVLERVRQGRLPDVLVLDWLMPGVTGLEVCQFLRAHEGTLDLPVLLLTVQRDTQHVVQALEAGANDFVAKPYAQRELCARVSALVRAKVLREQLAGAEARLRGVLAHLPHAVLSVDKAGLVSYANPRAKAVFGDGVEGRPLRDLLPMPLPDGTARDVVIDGAVYSLSMVQQGGDEDDLILTLHDVSQLRREEARKLDFYSMIAHDLRSPLTALNMRAHMLLMGQKGPLPEPAAEELRRMAARTRDMSQLVNDFLDVAQLEGRSWKLERQRVDLSKVCGDVAEEYGALAADRKVAIQVLAPEPAFVLGDPRRLRQVVTNLVSNAIKFTPAEGRVELVTGGDAECVELLVRDSGRGIEPEAQQKLFTKYGRIEGQGASRTEGTGLGLVIVKELVEAHGGSIGVDSEPGVGSRFRILLPRAA